MGFGSIPQPSSGHQQTTAMDARGLLMTAAEMARHVYMGDQSAPEPVAGISWQPTVVEFREEPEPDSRLVDRDAMYLPVGAEPLAAVQKESGFRAMAVRLGELYFIVNSGLDDPDETNAEEAASDLRAVIALAQGEASASHLLDALYFNQTILANHVPPGAGVVYVGHSLGGALAAGQAFHSWLKGFKVSVMGLNPIAARAFVNGVARALDVPDAAAAVKEFEQACKIVNFMAANQNELKQRLREGIRMLWHDADVQDSEEEEHVIARQVLTVLGTNHTRLGWEVALPGSTHDIDQIMAALRRDPTLRLILTREVAEASFMKEPEAPAAYQDAPTAQPRIELRDPLPRPLTETEKKTALVILKIAELNEKNTTQLIENDVLTQFRHKFYVTMQIEDVQEREAAQGQLISELLGNAYHKVAALYGAE